LVIGLVIAKVIEMVTSPPKGESRELPSRHKDKRRP